MSVADLVPLAGRLLSGALVRGTHQPAVRHEVPLVSEVAGCVHLIQQNQGQLAFMQMPLSFPENVHPDVTLREPARNENEK